MAPFSRLLDCITFKSKPKMTDTNFLANNFVNHPYQKVDVLKKCLERFGFKDKDCKIREKNGFEIQLPRKLTGEEMKEIYKEYDDTERERKKQANEQEEE
ncbi:hypothetical protein SUNI508_10648 [Seiridium unicorne]|uniref:Uncharacterized protein n=1 Tax=Seiridium unicorne TaxID=138068 RepID=A0ABR2UKA5_9PEZI